MVITERQMKIINQIILKNGCYIGDRYPYPASTVMMAVTTAQEAARVKLMIGSGADFEDVLCDILGVEANKKQA